MTQLTETLLNIALVTFILVNIVAAAAIIKKVFDPDPLLDDVNERLAVVEMAIESHNPVLQRNDYFCHNKLVGKTRCGEQCVNCKILDEFERNKKGIDLYL